MPDPRIAKLKADAARLAAQAKSDHQAAQYAERSGLREMSEANELERQARNKFSEVAVMEGARKKDLQQIHIARKQLALTEDAYRAMLHRLTGLDTTADMVAHQRRQVLTEFRRFGWSPKRSRKPRQSDSPAGMSDKILALWIELGKTGALRSKSDAALAAYCKRITGVDRTEWLDAKQASSVIEGLKQWLARVQRNT